VALLLLILLGVVVWAGFSLALAVVLFGPLATWRRRGPAGEVVALRPDRRRADRRIGLPDPRELAIERRSGADRRRDAAVA
jgi:hypothetical protein